MAQAAGKRRTKIPPLPSGSIYDLPSLTQPPHSASASPVNPSPSNAAATPRVSPSVQTPPGNSAKLQLLNLQIEKQQLELRLLELEAQSRATTTTKPQTVPLLDAVRSGSNNGKSQGQLDHNARITNPQEWPHLHVPFALSRKKFKDLSTAEFVYGYLDIYTSASPENQPLMMQHLMVLMRLASKFDWEAVLSFHAAVFDGIESGLAAWSNDFSEIERLNITESHRLKEAITGTTNAISVYDSADYLSDKRMNKLG